jgi:protein-tyrosine phosphatase
VILPPPRDPQQPYRICVVCLGNICRSPMAERVLRAELDRAGLGGRVMVDSAGTGDWHLGEEMDSRARAELSRRGYDGSGHEARQIQQDWLARYDLMLAMDRANLANLRQFAAGDLI